MSTVASDILQRAYENAGKVGRGVVPSPLQLISGLAILNDVIAYEVTRGLKLWLETEVTITLVASQQMYSIRPAGDVAQVRPLRVKEAAYKASGGSVRQLVQMSREEWNRAPNRTGTGAVSQYFIEKLYDRLNFYCWLTPDATAATGTILAVLANQGTLPLTVASDTRFPPEWGLFLQWRAAQELVTGMPQEMIMRCDQMTSLYREQLEGFDVEDAPTFFTVNTQGMGSKFL